MSKEHRNFGKELREQFTKETGWYRYQHSDKYIEWIESKLKEAESDASLDRIYFNSKLKKEQELNNELRGDNVLLGKALSDKNKELDKQNKELMEKIKRIENHYIKTINEGKTIHISKT